MRNFLLFFLLVVSGIVTGQSWKEIEKVLPPPPLIEQDGDLFGHAVSLSGNIAVVGAPEHNDEGSAFIYEFNGIEWVFQARLYPSAGLVSEVFGTAVSIYGDDVIIGATRTDSLGSNVGIAYIFSKPLTGWTDTTETATLTGTSIGSSDAFGRSVDISDSVAVVGSLKGAYVYKKTQSGWLSGTQNAILSRSDGLIGGFGLPVSLSDDDIAVGAPYGNSLPLMRGSVFVYTKPSSGWSNSFETAKFEASDGQYQDFFGACVKLDSGLLIVGATGDDDLNSEAGSAYVFKKPIGGWVDAAEDFKILPSTGYYNGGFGTSIDIDGLNFVIGAKKAEYAGVKSGVTYVFEANPSWSAASELAVIHQSNGSANDAFGSTTAILGNHIIVGAPDDDVNGLSSGAMFHYEKSNIGWVDTIETGTLEAPNYYYSFNHQASFGNSVAIDSNIAVIGSVNYDDYSRGAAFVYEFVNTQWVYRAMLTISTPQNYDRFGYSVDVSGDVIVVGAYNDGGNYTGTVGEGGAYVFVKPLTGWVDMTETAKLLRTDPISLVHFGNSVGIYDDDIVVGCYRDSNNGLGVGSAYVYSKPSGGWTTMTENAKLRASDELIGDLFGSVVDIHGNTIVIGNKPSLNFNHGKAYVFEKPLGGWVNSNEIAQLTTSVFNMYDKFGISIGIYDSIIAVGASEADGLMYTTGAVYLFKETSAGWQNTSEFATLLASDGQYGFSFGNSIDISEDKVIVGSIEGWFSPPGSSSYFQGGIYSFEKPLNGWVNDTLTYSKLPNVFGDSKFGSDVSIAGGQMVIGAQADNDFGQFSGAVYFYEECTPTYNSIFTTACQNYISPSGLVLDSTGVYIDYVLNAEGCDSIISIYLVVNKIDTTVYVDTNLLISNHVGGTYQWIDCDNGTILLGENNQSYIPSTSQGNYQVVVSDNGCTDTTACVFFEDCYPTSHSINIESCTQYVSPSGNHVYDSTGIYKDTLVNSFGCDSILTIYLEIPSFNLNVEVSGYGVELSSMQNSGNYQWIDCNNGFSPIAGATDSYYVVQNNGDYAVILSLNGCSDTTDCYNVYQVGLDDLNMDKVSVYPNPSNGIFTFESSFQVKNIIVYNYLGSAVKEITQSKSGNIIDLTKFAAGIYTVKLVGLTRQGYIKISKL